MATPDTFSEFRFWRVCEAKDVERTNPVDHFGCLKAPTLLKREAPGRVQTHQYERAHGSLSRFFSGNPRLARFLSPDPFVQSPDYTQSYNRYSYVWNNPLKYTDPSGEIVFTIIGALLAPVTGGASLAIGIAMDFGGGINLATKALQGKINSFGDGLAAYGIGAAAGAVGYFTGGAAFAAAGGAAGGAGGFLAGFASGAVGSAFSMPVLGMGNTAYFGDPMMSLQDYGIGILMGGFLAGTINGIVSIRNDNNFWTGNSQGSGRNPFAFNNTDRTHTHYRTEAGYESIDAVDRTSNAWIDAYDDSVQYGSYDNNGLSTGSISRRDNFLLPGESFQYDVSRFKGQSRIIFNGHINPNNQVNVLFDGVVVSQFLPGSYSTTNLIIPSNVQSVQVLYFGNFNNFLNNFPWKTTISGFLP